MGGGSTVSKVCRQDVSVISRKGQEDLVTYKARACEQYVCSHGVPCLSLLGTTKGTPDSVPVSSGGDRIRGGGWERERCCRQWLSGALPLKQGNGGNWEWHGRSTSCRRGSVDDNEGGEIELLVS